MTKRQRCENCTRPLPLCYCARLPNIVNHWPVHIIQHPSESRHALGTARIAHLGLSEATLTSYPIAPEDLETLTSQRIALIYPGDHSEPLEQLQGSSPRRLVFIDATWRKSKRMLLESSFLGQLPRYTLPVTAPSRYRIRKEPSDQSLSTLEAIVSALGILENDDKRYLPLLEVMDTLIAQQTSRMPPEVLRENYSQDKKV